MGVYYTVFLVIGLIWAFVAFALLIISWRAATRGDIRLHKPLMLVLTAGAWIFMAAYIARYALIEGGSPEVPSHLVPWLAVHGSAGLVPLFGSTALVAARLLSREDSHGPGGHLNRHHRFYGRTVASFWLFTHAGGMLNFYLFF